jgi:hypothetical protein
MSVAIVFESDGRRRSPIGAVDAEGSVYSGVDSPTRAGSVRSDGYVYWWSRSRERRMGKVRAFSSDDVGGVSVDISRVHPTGGFSPGTYIWTGPTVGEARQRRPGSNERRAGRWYIVQPTTGDMPSWRVVGEVEGDDVRPEHSGAAGLLLILDPHPTFYSDVDAAPEPRANAAPAGCLLAIVGLAGLVLSVALWLQYPRRLVRPSPGGIAPLSAGFRWPP